MIKIHLIYIAIVFYTLLIGCANQSKQTELKIPDYLPEELIISNFHDADFVAAVEVEKVTLNPEESIRDDSGRIGYAMLVYEGEVFHSYKGNLEKGKIVFRHLQEYDDGLLEQLNKTKMSKIVFLKKGDKAGEYIAPEFSIFTYTEELHLALIDLSKK
jgi:hypothetical protein